jgi:hypothetical protein
VNEGTSVIVRLPLDGRPAAQNDEPRQKLIALDIPQRKAANG